MASQYHNESGMISGINVTPLVDIMLVLLIIFMVTAKLAIPPATALPLQLPQASSGQAVQVIFSIALFSDGSTAVNGKKVENDDAVLSLARTEHESHPELKAIIQADGRVYHERVVHIMDLLSQANISQIAFGVVPRRAGDQSP